MPWLRLSFSVSGSSDVIPLGIPLGGVYQVSLAYLAFPTQITHTPYEIPCMWFPPALNCALSLMASCVFHPGRSDRTFQHTLLHNALCEPPTSFNAAFSRLLKSKIWRIRSAPAACTNEFLALLSGQTSMLCNTSWRDALWRAFAHLVHESSS